MILNIKCTILLVNIKCTILLVNIKCTILLVNIKYTVYYFRLKRNLFNANRCSSHSKPAGCACQRRIEHRVHGGFSAAGTSACHWLLPAQGVAASLCVAEGEPAARHQRVPTARRRCSVCSTRQRPSIEGCSGCPPRHQPVLSGPHSPQHLAAAHTANARQDSAPRASPAAVQDSLPRRRCVGCRQSASPGHCPLLRHEGVHSRWKHRLSSRHPYARGNARRPQMGHKARVQGFGQRLGKRTGRLPRIVTSLFPVIYLQRT